MDGMPVPDVTIAWSKGKGLGTPLLDALA